MLNFNRKKIFVIQIKEKREKLSKGIPYILLGGEKWEMEKKIKNWKGIW